jgi:hypothetical protein
VAVELTLKTRVGVGLALVLNSTSLRADGGRQTGESQTS